MTALDAGSPGQFAASESRLRRVTLAEIRSRDLWADEAALWGRPVSLAGLDDAAWHLPGAAPSDARPHGHVRKHLAMLGPWCVASDPPVGEA